MRLERELNDFRAVPAQIGFHQLTGEKLRLRGISWFLCTAGAEGGRTVIPCVLRRRGSDPGRYVAFRAQFML